MGNVAKCFVVLVHGLKNIDLVKDLGSIPYFMHHQFGYRSKVVCHKNDEQYFYLESEARGLEIEFLKRVKLPLLNLSPILYLFKNAWKIDILNLYHLSFESSVYGIIYKMFNPGGVLYLKTDLGVVAFGRYASHKNHHFFLPRAVEFAARWILQELVIRVLIGISSVVSTETTPGLNLLHARYGAHCKKIIYIPDGTVDRKGDSRFENIKKVKENIICTVGRIGAPEKNNRMLLDACTKLKFYGWKVVMVGNVEHNFQMEIDEVFRLHPGLHEKVLFPGFVADREQLEEYYLRSKVFCLTSDWESFGIVLVEALMAGCFIVTTRIPSGNDITDNGKYGRLVDFGNSDMLAGILQKIINGDIDWAQNMCDAVRYAQAKFLWPNIVKDLNASLEARA